MRVVRRDVTEEDRKKNRYFEHMADQVGIIQNIYANDEIAIKIEQGSMTKITSDVHKTAGQRMRDKFVASVSDEQRKLLTAEELGFEPNYVLLVQGTDLVRI